MTSQPSKAQTSPVIHLVAPILAIGATMIFRKVLNQGYRTVMGTAPPDPMNPKQPILRAAAWAAVTAASAAVVEVLVMRFATGSGVEQDHEQSLQTGPAGVS